ncbi:MAG: helix-turn-helix transcriptional regulator [Bacteroidia bacterium]
MKIIGNNIKRIRELKNLSQEYVANNLGISQSAYSRRELGMVKTDADMLKDIAEILEVTVDDVIHFHEKNLFGKK